MKFKIVLFSLIIGVLMGFSVSANADTLTVPSTTYPTIAAAMAADNDGDIVSIAAGTYAEDVAIDKSITFKCASSTGVVTITGAALDATTLAISGSASSAIIQNVSLDISANAAKVTAANPAVSVATGINNVRLYNSSFKVGAKANVAIQFNGAASGWQIENCTFDISTTSNSAIVFAGAAAVANMDILGNTFNGINGINGVTDAKMIWSKHTVTSLTGLNVTGNVVSKATLQIDVDTTKSSNVPIHTINIAVNQFTESNAILFQSTNAAGVPTVSAGGVLAVAGDILIKGNHFGSTATNGNQQYAVKFDKWVTAHVNESNIHVNYNNIQYPMTSGVDTNTNGGHITQTGGTLAGIDAKFNWWGTLTGYNTSYQDGGNGVCNAAFDGTNFISQYVVPQVDETNRGVELYDWDGNGKIDRAVVFFDYYVDPATVSNYGGWTVAGYTLNSSRLPKLGLDNSGGGSSDGPYALTLFLVEGSNMDTGAKPEVTYAKQNGYVTGITGNINAKLNDIAAGTATEHDKAKPVIKSAVTGDTNKNGKIDRIIVTFSEAITLHAPTGGSIDDTDWDNNVAITAPGGYALTPDVSTGSSDVLTLVLNEVGYDTDIKPSFSITTDGSDDYKDNAGNIITSVAYTTTSDGAPPVAYAVATRDWSTSDRGVGNPDGYIDGFTITFSEAVSIAYADSAAARNAFAVEKVENSVDLKTSLITVAGTTMSIKGKSLKDAASGYGTHPWDTDKKPTLTYTSQGGIKDAAGNAWVTFWKSVNTASATVFNETTDGAAPSIVKAVGQVNSTNVYVTFSEAVKGTGASNTLVAANFAYVNVFNTGANATTVVGLSKADASSQADPTATLTVDATLLVQDVENDSLKVAVLGNIQDMSAAINDLPVLNVTINDIIPPELISAVTKDVDNDGWIDHILLTFSETVDNAALAGWNGTDKLSLNAAVNWEVAGYEVIAINPVTNATEQATATTDAISRGLNFAKDELGKVINVSDSNTADNQLWLMVAEGSGADKSNGDTQAVPTVTITGGDGAKVWDYKPNKLVTVSRSPQDGAGPAIMSAKMTGTKSMQVTFSETVCDSLAKTSGTITGSELTGSDLFIRFGEAYADLGISSIIKDITQNAGVVDFVWQNTEVPANETGWIGFASVGVVKDVSAQSTTNTQVFNLPNMVGLKKIEAFVFDEFAPIAGASNLTVTDVPNDNGRWFYARFKPSTNNMVNSYQFYRKDKPAGAADSVWVYFAVVPKTNPASDGFCYVMVPTPKNGVFKYNVAASTGTVISSFAAKEGEMAVAELVSEAAAKEAASVVSDFTDYALGGAEDNIAPSPVTGAVAADNDGAGTGIKVSWTNPADHGVVGYFKISDVQVPIYGADAYNVYRKAAGADNFVLAGTAGEGATSFIDMVADGTTVYEYIVKATDGTFEVPTTVPGLAMAGNGTADFNVDGNVSLGDLVLLGNMWGKKAADTGWIVNYDLNKDGSIGLGDLVILGSQWTSAKKSAKAAPMPGVALDLTAELNEATSMYYVTVGSKDALEGLAFTMKYDTNLYEFVKESVTGLGVASVANETKAGVIDIASVYGNEKFSGAITLGFKSLGKTGTMNLELANAEVALNGVIGSVNDQTVTLKALPTVYTLAQNFPNPFNPTTTIEYSIPTAGHTTLAIYNLAGQKIRTLVNDVQAPNFYKVVWDGKNDSGMTVATGTYFYKLVSGNYSKTVKMNLIK